MMRTNTHRGARRGFTLLELAVVIGIISLIAGAGMNMATGALKAADRVTTQERLNTIKLALDSFGKTYGYLPCPANRLITPSDPNFGVAAATCSSNTPAVAPFQVEVGSNVAVGAVPVRTLGLPDSYAGDAWGNKMSYAVSNGLTVNPTRYVTNGGAGAAISIRFGTLSPGPFFQQANQRQPPLTGGNASGSGGFLVVTYGSGTAPAMNTIVNITSANHNGTARVTGVAGLIITTDMPYAGVADANVRMEWDSAGAGATYVVVSHGPDGRGAFPLNGTAIPTNKLCNTSNTANSSPAPCNNSATATCIDIENCGSGTSGTQPAASRINTIFYDTAYNDGPIPETYFDDYVVWGSNAGERATVNNSLYTKLTSSCPTGVCEAWCAGCELNYPGGSNTAAPPAAAIYAATTPLDSASGSIKLCKKVITSNAADCKASCFWSGATTLPANGYYKCP